MIGSTRSVALMRIGLALVALVEIGEVTHLRHHPEFSPFYLAVIAMVLGIRARGACLAVAAGIVLTVLFAHEKLPRDTYAIAAACALLALTPCGNSISIDHWRRKTTETGNVAALRVLAAAFTLLLLWNSYSEIALGKPRTVIAGVVILVAAGAAWVPRARIYAVGAALVIMVVAHVFASLPALDVLLAFALALAHVPPAEVDAAIDDIVGRDDPGPGDPPADGATVHPSKGGITDESAS